MPTRTVILTSKATKNLATPIIVAKKEILHFVQDDRVHLPLLDRQFAAGMKQRIDGKENATELS
jgi:hypothetical protein